MGISGKSKKKLTDEAMAQHREYMKKYKMQSSDLENHEMRYKDHYEQLGVPRNASHTEIRKAYRKLALKCHPDRKPSSEALARWEGVPTAYAVLSNPNDRAKYDATLPTRDALVEFYRAYNPAKLNNATVQTIIDGWYGREVELFSMLNVKYEVAPHQGTTKAAQRAAAMSVSREEGFKIAMDSQASKPKDAANAEITWTGAIGYVFCCKSMASRIFGATYHELVSASPGTSTAHGASDTPGQAIPTNIKSTATLSELSTSMYDLTVDEENLSSTSTADGSPPSANESCCAEITDDSHILPLDPQVAQAAS